MNPLHKTARIAGFLYMMMAITGPFVLLYVPGKLFVYSDAAATANNILTHESLFRAYIVIGIISELLFIATVLVLYKLLKEVNLTLAFVMVLLVLLDAPTSFLSVANQIATLAFVKGADFLSVFDKPQRDALATLFINIDKHGILVSEFFWGAWLLPLGILVYRSGFLPRLIGVWLFINGIAYIIISFTGMLLPQYLKMVNDVALPVLFGELAFALWLLIAGAKPKPLVNTA